MSKKRGSRLLIMNSKAQVAIFMIISVFILLAGLLYFYYQKTFVEKEVEIVQPEVVPIKQYVENCIKNLAEDGLQRIGLTGGYIDIQQAISNNPKRYLAPLKISGFKIPYWWHDGIDSVPPENFINQQLRSSIKNELRNCINNFEPFADRYSIKELKDAIVNVNFNENDVTISLNYPLEIGAKFSGFKATRENFAYTVPIRFKKIYELARLIMERENKDNFVEQKTIDLYSMDTDIPTTDVEATCSAKLWQLSDIRKKLATLLRVNLPYIRIKGTDYNPSLYVPNPNGKSIYSETYFQSHYIWELDKNTGDKYNNMKVSFAYENWPLSIYARPSENGILKSNSQKGTNTLSFFCLHVWHFTYDISYPVIVTVYDRETENNRAYQFNFAFKVSIEHNQPNRANTGTESFDTVPDASSDEYCNNVQNQVTVFTVNNATEDDLKDVNLTFVCGRFYCDMGQSNWLSFGASAGITRKFPYCVNGLIKGSKNGFSDAQSFIQTDANDRSYVLLMNPVKGFSNYKVVKHQLSSPRIEEELGQNEKVSIIIKGNDTGFESFSAYPPESSLPLTILDSKDAIYEVSIYLVDNDTIIGGYAGYWKVSKDDLKNSQEVVFHVIEQGAATDDERALFISALDTYSKKIPAPEFKKIK